MRFVFAKATILAAHSFRLHAGQRATTLFCFSNYTMPRARNAATIFICGATQHKEMALQTARVRLGNGDLYQVGQLLPSDRKSVPTAPGSVGPPQGSNIRATLILKSESGQWRVIAARVADIRAVNEQKTLALK